MFVIDDLGVILMVNEASSKAFGYSCGDLLHHNISKMCGGGHAKHQRELHGGVPQNRRQEGHREGPRPVAAMSCFLNLKAREK